MVRHLFVPLTALALALGPGAAASPISTSNAPRPQATPCDCDWVSTFGSSFALNGAVRAALVFDGGGGPELFVGGDFTSAGGIPVDAVATYDGVSFEPVGAGAPFAVEFLSSFAPAGQAARLLATGDLGVAQWDGTAWSTVGAVELSFPNYPGELPNVSGVAVHDDGSGPQLYVCGRFDVIDAVPAPGFARWNGAVWDASLPSPLAGGPLVSFDDGSGAKLYCGGQGRRLDPGGWVTLGDTPVNLMQLRVVDVGGGPELFAAGAFGAPGASVTSVARWDGLQWQLLGLPGQFLSTWALGEYDDGSGPALIASAISTPVTSSSARLHRWNGASWSLLPSAFTFGALPSSPLALAEFDFGAGHRLVAAGGFSAVGGFSASQIAAFDGVAWQGPPSGIDSSVRALRVFDDGNGPKLVAAGDFSQINGASLSRIAQWDGAGWSALGGGLEGSVRALEVHDDGSGPALFAGGFFFEPSAPGNTIARWDGAAWSPLGAGLSNFSGGPGAQAGPSALKSFDDGSGPALFAAGFFKQAGAVAVTSIAKWDGASWSAVGAPFAGGLSGVPIIRALEIFDDGGGPALYATGSFATVGGASVNSIARWNGVSWTSVGAGLGAGTSGGFALAVFDDGSGPALAVGGGFAAAGGLSSTNVALWRASGWSALGNGAMQIVAALRVYDDGCGPALFAGGGAAGGGNVMRWSGGWSTVAPGAFNGFFVDSVHAFAEFDDGSGAALFAGGTAAAFPSGDSRLAKYACNLSPSPRSYCTPATGTSAGCIPTIGANAQPNVAHSTPCVVTASNVNGQRSGLLMYGVSGQQFTPWCNGGLNLLCVAPPRQRTHSQSSGGTAGACDGALTLDWSAYQLGHPTALGNPWIVGATVEVQGWFRDPLACRASALTEALQLVYQ